VRETPGQPPKTPDADALAAILRDDARFEPPARAVLAARALGARIADRAPARGASVLAHLAVRAAAEIGGTFDRAGAAIAAWIAPDGAADGPRLAFAGLRHDIAPGFASETLSAVLSDAGVSDDGVSAAGVSEAGLSESGPSKSGTSKSGTSKSGPSKSGPSKSGPSKSGPSNSGLTIRAERTRAQDGIVRLVGEVHAIDRSPARATIVVLDAHARILAIDESDEIGLFHVRLPDGSAEIAFVPHPRAIDGDAGAMRAWVLPLDPRGTA
jgi:hypothetical protein